MVLCRDARCGLGGGAAGETACAPRLQGHARKDRPQGCPWHCAVAATGVVPAGALQVSAGTGNAGSADRTEAVANEISGRDDEPAWRAAWLRAEGRVDHAAALCSAHPRTGGRTCDPDGDR